MGSWFWLNIPLCAVIFSAVAGIPLWMVFKHPDTGEEVKATAARVRRMPLHAVSMAETDRWRSSQGRGSGFPGQDHLQGPGAMYPLHPGKLNVAGRGRAADPGERAARRGGQPGDGLGDQLHDLRRVHDAQVVVGNQGDRAAALPG